jgi:hypothetical protein
MGVTVDDARTIAAALPRSYEALVRDRFRFRVGQIVYAAFSQDETIMGAIQICRSALAAFGDGRLVGLVVTPTSN